jgi:hypothetical protein
MTRLLSEILQAPEPSFRLGLRQLEQANGNPSADIRLTAELLQQPKAKLRELGLDAHDTTGEELYHTLQARVKADDVRLEKVLRTEAATYISAEGDVMAGMVHALENAAIAKTCFALKAMVFKTLLKKQPPKRAMKQLGYRSLDSMIKQESSANLLAAAYLSESPAWCRSWVEQYKRLQPSDFEIRRVSITSPATSRWQNLARKAVADKQHTVLGFKELGSVILLPLPAERPTAAVLSTVVLALHELNAIQAASSFLKLSQVRADFGRRVQTVVTSEPQLKTGLLDQLVPWQLIQKYYARLKLDFDQELFEPYLQVEDFSGHSIEHVLSQIAPALAFWEHTPHLSLLHDHRPVSFNILDAALDCCNKISYESRSVEHARAELWNELMLRYLKHDTVEQAITSELQPQFATEPALI